MDKAHVQNTLEALTDLEANGLDSKELRILLSVYLNEGEGILEIAAKSNVSKSAFSRSILFLSNERQHKERPDGAPALVDVRTHPREWRKKAVYLTREGEEFVTSIITKLRK